MTITLESKYSVTTAMESDQNGRLGGVASAFYWIILSLTLNKKHIIMLK